MPQAPAVERLSPETRALADEVVALRRDFHKHPELDFDLPRTAEKVSEYLKGLGLEVKTGIAKTGVVGILRGGKPGPTALYRADMDALPLQEETGAEYASVNEGVMHACGHDGHMAVALGLAKLMHQRKDSMPGSVAFLFQPAEEGGGGAPAMIKEGVLDYIKPDVCFAMHLNNDEETGVVGVRPGAVFAGSGEFFVTLASGGGHGASPHQAVDLVVTAADMITSLQSVISRNVDPRDSAVVTVGQIHIGTKENILATEGKFSGTIRYFDKKVNDHIVRRVEDMLGGVARAHGAGFSFEYEPGYPATINDAAITRLVQDAVKSVAPLSDYWTTGSEDMSFFLEKVPGCYYTVGTKSEAKGKIFPHHSGSFDIDEDALPMAVEVGARILDSYLGGKNC
jgi:amidohydrolase